MKEKYLNFWNFAWQYDITTMS